MTSHSSKHQSSSSFVLKLVCHYLKKPPEAVKPEYRTALHVLSNSVSKFDVEESAVCGKIIQKFMQQDRVKDALTFGDLYRKLQNSSVLKNKASVLCFLYNLFDNNSNSEVNLNASLEKCVNKVKTVDLTGLFMKSKTQDSNVPYSLLVDHTRSSKPSSAKSSRSRVDNSSKHSIEKSMNTRSDESNIGSICCTLPSLKSFLKDVLYGMQGMSGETIQWNPDKSDVNFMGDFPNPVKRMALRFLEMGHMYHQLDQFCTTLSNQRALGLVGQSLVSALRAKLTEYYKLIAELETMLNQDSLTLHRMSVWLLDPYLELRTLVSVAESCKGCHGGGLVSVLCGHLQHGDPTVRELVGRLLSEVSRPLFRMLASWVYCGELDDVFGEFFISVNPTVSFEALWHSRYSVNKDMLPVFISTKQASRILSTGKALNYLRQIGSDLDIQTPDLERKMRSLELIGSEELFLQEKNADFDAIINKNYSKINKIVLQVLRDKYNLLLHLQGVRDYLLLGQGDFVSHLMDLLDGVLSETMKTNHNISSYLDTAVRATNAQFHHPDVRERLDYRFLEESIGDVGWDLFALEYHNDGPISTLLTTSCMLVYSKLFVSMWKTKRMEYILCKISRARSSYMSMQHRIPELGPLLFQINILLAQMVHFVQQVQYYTAFEVMECSWGQLTEAINAAEDLDQVISAHDHFLNVVVHKALLDHDNKRLREKLHSIFDLIIEFDRIQSSFFKNVSEALDHIDQMQALKDENTNKQKWGITEEQQIKYSALLEKIKHDDLPHTKAQLIVLSSSYDTEVQQFLFELNSSRDIDNLSFLSFRLDFNEYYNRKNELLSTSLTLQHRRLSKGLNESHCPNASLVNERWDNCSLLDRSLYNASSDWTNNDQAMMSHLSIS